MGADLNNIVKCQALSDEHVQFLIYQLLRGLKVGAGVAGGAWGHKGPGGAGAWEPDARLPPRSTSTPLGSSTG